MLPRRRIALVVALSLPAVALADRPVSPPSPPSPAPAPPSPSLGVSCLGRWHGTGRGDVVTLTEVYTHNPGTCAPAGRIDARCEPDVMQWTWTGQELVRSQLQRVTGG